MISERVFGDATGSGEKRYGNSISYNPSAKGFIIGDFTAGLETAAGYGMWFVSGCDATTLKFGGNMAYLVCDGSTTYSWAAYAKK